MIRFVIMTSKQFLNRFLVLVEAGPRHIRPFQRRNDIQFQMGILYNRKLRAAPKYERRKLLCTLGRPSSAQAFSPSASKIEPGKEWC